MLRTFKTKVALHACNIMSLFIIIIGIKANIAENHLKISIAIVCMHN